MVAAKQRKSRSQQQELGDKEGLLSLSSGQGLKGPGREGGEVKVTKQGREETTKTRDCPSPEKRLR